MSALPQPGDEITRHTTESPDAQFPLWWADLANEWFWIGREVPRDEAFAYIAGGPI